VISQIRRNPQARWIGLGDFIDAILRKQDRRHFERNYAEWLWGKDDIIHCQIDKLLEYLSPIAEKCLALLSGNHEKAVLRHSDQDAYGRIVRGIAHAGHQQEEDLLCGTSGFLTLLFKRGDPGEKSPPVTKFTIYCHHGYGGGKLKGGKALNLERTMLQFPADIVLLGHVHDLLFTPKVTIGADGAQHISFGACVPSFLKTYELNYESYAEDLGYFPSVLGTFPIELVPDKRYFTFHLSSA